MGHAERGMLGFRGPEPARFSNAEGTVESYGKAAAAPHWLELEETTTSPIRRASQTLGPAAAKGERIRAGRRPQRTDVQAAVGSAAAKEPAIGHAHAASPGLASAASDSPSATDGRPTLAATSVADATS